MLVYFKRISHHKFDRIKALRDLDILCGRNHIEYSKGRFIRDDVGNAFFKNKMCVCCTGAYYRDGILINSYTGFVSEDSIN